MEVFKISKKESNAFNTQQLLLSEEQGKLLAYLGHINEIDSFQKQIDTKRNSYSELLRQELTTTLARNYEGKNYPKAIASIELLKKPTTFTVTTGHQLCLFTGPSYVIYKILHTIQLARKLKVAYPQYDFVPVYWMASEDHDIEEIRSLQLFNKKISWDEELAGAVGDLPLTGLQRAIESLQGLFREDTAEQIIEISSITNQQTYAEYMFDFVAKLFQDFELIILQPHQHSLKKHFLAVAEKELNSSFSYHAVNETNLMMDKDGFQKQINPREVNLFYLSGGKRERIVKKNHGFSIGEKSFTMEQLIEEFRQNPKYISPNVVLRPVYQELILPNLAYVGGAGELSYWMQLKKVFQGVDLPYPILQLRKSFQVTDKKSFDKWLNLGFTIEDFFKPTTELIQRYTERKMNEENSFQNAHIVFQELKRELNAIGDKEGTELKKWLSSESIKLEKQVLQIEQKIKRTIKQKHEDQINWIEKQKERFFPSGNLQEREVNFFHFCADGKIHEKLQTFLNEIDPFDPSVVVLVN